MFLVRICLIWVNQREYAAQLPHSTGSAGWHLVYSRSTRNSLYTNVTAILSTAESSCPILVCKYTSGTCPKPLHVLHGRCFWDWRGRRELWEVNEPNPGCLVQGSVECRSRTGSPGYPLTAGAFLVPMARMHGTPGTVSDKLLTTTCTLSR